MQTKPHSVSQFISLFIQIPREGTIYEMPGDVKNKSNIPKIRSGWQVLTLLAVVGGPAAVAVVVIEAGPNALRSVLHDTWTNITAFFGLLVPSDVVVKLCIHNERPVHRV